MLYKNIDDIICGLKKLVKLSDGGIINKKLLFDFLKPFDNYLNNQPSELYLPAHYKEFEIYPIDDLIKPKDIVFTVVAKDQHWRCYSHSEWSIEFNKIFLNHSINELVGTRDVILALRPIIKTSIKRYII